MCYQKAIPGEIQLDVPASVLHPLLRYLYTGDLTIAPYLKPSLASLAQQLHLPLLARACDQLVNQTESSTNCITDAGDRGYEVKTAIDLKEIWGESDSDSDVDGDGGVGDDVTQDDAGSSECEGTWLKNSSDGTLQEADCEDISCQPSADVQIECAETHDKSNEVCQEDSTHESTCSYENNVMHVEQTEDIEQNRENEEVVDTIGNDDGEEDVVVVNAPQFSASRKRKCSQSDESLKRSKLDEDEDCIITGDTSYNMKHDRVCDDSCNRSSVDLFSSPTPKKSLSCTQDFENHASSKSLSIDEINTNSVLHSSTPSGSGRTVNMLKPRVSLIPTDSPKSCRVQASDYRQELNTTIDELLPELEKWTNADQPSDGEKHSSNQVGIELEHEDKGTDSPYSDDVEITGVDYSENISGEQASPKFSSRSQKRSKDLSVATTGLTTDSPSCNILETNRSENQKSTQLVSFNNIDDCSLEAHSQPKLHQRIMPDKSLRKAHDISESFIEDSSDDQYDGSGSQTSEIVLLTTENDASELDSVGNEADTEVTESACADLSTDQIGKVLAAVMLKMVDHLK